MALPLALMGGIMSAVPATYKLISGIRQAQQGKAGLRRLDRPEYEIPAEQKEALNIARQRYADKFMPGQGMFMDRIEQQAANAFTMASEAGNPFAAITNIQSQASNQMQDLQTRAMQQQLMNEQAYQQQLATMAGFQEKEWQLNEFAPYKDKYTEFRDMIGAGNKNIYGGLDSLAGIGTSILSSTLGMGGGDAKQSLDQDAINQALQSFQNLQKYGNAGGDISSQAEGDVMGLISNLMNAETAGGQPSLGEMDYLQDMNQLGVPSMLMFNP